MKTLRAFSLFVGLLAAGGAWAQETKTLPPNKGLELIEQAVQAMGGEAYLNVRGFIREGRFYTFSRGELASPGVVFIEYFQYPDKSRIEFFKQRNIINVNNGEEGWELDMQGIREQTPESLADFKQSLSRDIDTLLRQRRNEAGVQFYYQGSQFQDNRRVDIVEMVDAENESYLIHLDGQTHLPVQLRYRERDDLTGEMVDVAERFSLYVDFQGIRTPRQITRERAGLRIFEVFDIKMKYNPEIAETLFTRESLEERWRKMAKKQKPKKKKKGEEEEP